jgi:hypothetical protein
MDYPVDGAHTAHEPAGERLKNTTVVTGLAAVPIVVAALRFDVFNRTPSRQLSCTQFSFPGPVWGAPERGTACATGEYIGGASSRPPCRKVSP